MSVGCKNLKSLKLDINPELVFKNPVRFNSGITEYEDLNVKMSNFTTLTSNFISNIQVLDIAGPSIRR